MVKSNKPILIIWNEKEFHVTNSIQVAVDKMGEETNYKTYYSFLDRWKNKQYSRIYDTGLMKCQRFRDLEDLKIWSRNELFSREQEVRRLEKERTEISNRKDETIRLIDSQFEEVLE